MKVIVSDNGKVVFSYDERKDAPQLCPGNNEKRAVVAALDEARQFLAPDVGPVLDPRTQEKES